MVVKNWNGHGRFCHSKQKNARDRVFLFSEELTVGDAAHSHEQLWIKIKMVNCILPQIPTILMPNLSKIWWTAWFTRHNAEHARKHSRIQRKCMGGSRWHRAVLQVASVSPALLLSRLRPACVRAWRGCPFQASTSGRWGRPAAQLWNAAVLWLSNWPKNGWFFCRGFPADLWFSSWVLGGTTSVHTYRNKVVLLQCFTMSALSIHTVNYWIVRFYFLPSTWDYFTVVSAGR